MGKLFGLPWDRDEAGVLVASHRKFQKGGAMRNSAAFAIRYARVLGFLGLKATKEESLREGLIQ
ncbi:MAG: hypothetical protein V4437_01785 [Patescibacteria group bacterium]